MPSLCWPWEKFVRIKYRLRELEWKGKSHLSAVRKIVLTLKSPRKGVRNSQELPDLLQNHCLQWSEGSIVSLSPRAQHWSKFSERLSRVNQAQGMNGLAGMEMGACPHWPSIWGQGSMLERTRFHPEKKQAQRGPLGSEPSKIPGFETLP